MLLALTCLVAPSVGRLAAAQTTQADFDAIAKAAAAARDAGDVRTAIEDYGRAVVIRPDWQEGWYYLGTLQYDADRYADAIRTTRPGHWRRVEFSGSLRI
jgi:tetratricopeptide (TPR) repeat protein